MILTLAKLLANLAGLAWETAGDWVRGYISFLVRATLAGLAVGLLGIGCLTVGVRAEVNSLAAIGMLFLLCALATIHIVTLPISIPTEWAAEKWQLFRRKLDGLCILILQGFLLSFYIIIDNGTQHPSVVYGLAGLYVLEGIAILLPSDAWPIAFFRNRVGKYLVVGAAVILTLGRILPTSVLELVDGIPGINTWTTPREVVFGINDLGQLVDARTNTQIELFNSFADVSSPDPGPEPRFGTVYNEQTQRLQLFSWFKGQINRSPYDGQTIQPLGPNDVARLVQQARRDRTKNETLRHDGGAQRVPPVSGPTERPAGSRAFHETPSTTPDDRRIPAGTQRPAATREAAHQSVARVPLEPSAEVTVSEQMRVRDQQIALVTSLAQSVGDATPPSAAVAVVKGQSVVLSWSPTSSELASQILGRLRALGARVMLEPKVSTSPTAARASVEYLTDRHEMAVALRSTVIDLVRLDLNAHGRFATTVIDLP